MAGCEREIEKLVISVVMGFERSWIAIDLLRFETRYDNDEIVRTLCLNVPWATVIKSKNSTDSAEEQFNLRSLEAW